MKKLVLISLFVLYNIIGYGEINIDRMSPRTGRIIKEDNTTVNMGSTNRAG